MDNRPRILILNGPNLNLLGEREPEIYGTEDMDIILRRTGKLCPDAHLSFRQTNHEGDLIDLLHDAWRGGEYVGVVLNAGAYAHTSLALADAIAGIQIPVVEVHMSNTAAREPIRQKSLIAPVCRGTITGFGADSYRLAINALLYTLEDK